jgi:hypothetical protein
MNQTREVPADLKAVFESDPELLPRIMRAGGYSFRRRLLAQAASDAAIPIAEEKIDAYALLLTYRASLLSEAELDRLTAGVGDMEVMSVPVTVETLLDHIPESVFADVQERAATRM